MRIVKLVIGFLIALFVFGFLHYTLPQRDIVRIVGTYEERQTLQGWTTMFWGNAQSPPVNGIETRDVQFIQAVRPNGDTVEYRNEDTGWGWPPYFKFDTASLYTEAADAVSDKDNPEWVIMHHYGWRSELLSIFPNAVKLEAATGPNQPLYPIKNGLILLGFVVILLLLRRAWVGFRRRTIDPLVEDMEDRWDDASYATQSRARGLKRFFSREK